MGQDRYGNRTMNLAEADEVFGTCESLLTGWLQLLYLLFIPGARRRLASDIAMARATLAYRAARELAEISPSAYNRFQPKPQFDSL